MISTTSSTNNPHDPIKIGIVSISDRASTGVYVDQGLPALQSWLTAALQNPITFSAAMIAYVEAHYPDDDVRNKLCADVPFPQTLADYPRTMMVTMMNQMQWSQDKTLRNWMRETRLDGFGKLMSNIDPSDTEKLAIMGNFRTQAMAAMANMPKLLAR